MQELSFVRVGEADAARVLAVYRSLVGTPGCSWNEHYPNAETVDYGIRTGSQYMLVDGEGEIVCACGLFREADEITDPRFAWQGGFQKPCYFSGMGVAAAHQGKGIAGLMLRHIIKTAADEGFDGAYALVAQSNDIARRAYSGFGFVVTGEAEYYGQMYDLYEMTLGV